MKVGSLHNYFQDEEEQNEKVEETNDDHEENDEEEELIEELGNTSNIVAFIRNRIVNNGFITYLLGFKIENKMNDPLLKESNHFVSLWYHYS